MADPRVQEHQKVKEFRDLVSGTIGDLRLATTPSALARAIDQHLPGWETADPDFAAVLRDLRGQAYAMGPQHLRAVSAKLCEHLQVNLDWIDKSLQKL